MLIFLMYIFFGEVLFYICSHFLLDCFILILHESADSSHRLFYRYLLCYFFPNLWLEFHLLSINFVIASIIDIFFHRLWFRCFRTFQQIHDQMNFLLCFLLQLLFAFTFNRMNMEWFFCENLCLFSCYSMWLSYFLLPNTEKTVLPLLNWHLILQKTLDYLYQHVLLLPLLFHSPICLILCATLMFLFMKVLQHCYFPCCVGCLSTVLL